MTFQSEFVDLPLEELHSQAAVMKGEGWRFMQTHAVYTDDGIDLYYSFMKDGLTRNYRVKSVGKGTSVPSITDLFLAAFVFENEARELFGVDMRDIAIDFDGALYAPAEQEPMTILTPEMKAARDKARKAAAAKAAKAAAVSGENAEDKPEAAKGGFVMTPERQARLDAKMASMSPEKKAKVEAALKARAAEATSAPANATTKPAPKPEVKEPAKTDVAPERRSTDEVLEAKIAAMDPEKARKVRAALGGTENNAKVNDNVAADVEHQKAADAQLEEKLAAMDPAKAEKVRAALAARESIFASKGGE